MIHRSFRPIAVVPLLMLAAVASMGSPARALLILTPAGVAEGLSLSTFAINFPSSGGVGPLGIAFPSSGGVLVSDFPGNVRLFPTDTDGQNAALVPVVQNYGFGNALGMAQLGGNIYMNRQSIGDTVQINDNGTFNQVIVTGEPQATGIVANPVNGHLFVSAPNGTNIIFDVDPVAKTKTTFLNNQVADGLTITPDGSILYAAVGNDILGFNTTSAAQVFDSGAIAGGPDGTALGFGSLAGSIFANTNAGTVVQVNLNTLAQTLIASGGSRGDFVTVDPNNNSILLTQTDSIVRINGGQFVPAATPEPGTLSLIGTGLAALAMRRRRKQSL